MLQYSKKNQYLCFFSCNCYLTYSRHTSSSTCQGIGGWSVCFQVIQYQLLVTSISITEAWRMFYLKQRDVTSWRKMVDFWVSSPGCQILMLMGQHLTRAVKQKCRYFKIWGWESIVNYLSPGSYVVLLYYWIPWGWKVLNLREICKKKKKKSRKQLFEFLFVCNLSWYTAITWRMTGGTSCYSES